MTKQTLILPLVLCVATLAGATQAWGKANGFPGDSCSGCHRGGGTFKATITADPPEVMPGGTATLTIAIESPAAGLYLSSSTKGFFTLIPGEGLMKTGTETGVTHTSPKSASGGQVTFKVKWTAPNMPGGVDFDLAAVAANGDGSTRGDGEGFLRFNYSYGCEGVNVYLDQDGDGWGLSDLRGPQRKCELQPGWTLKPGDCNDYDKNANPMGTEVCNLYDDDCDGMINEGLEGVTVYRDEDGDGHGARFNAMSQVGCGNGLGWSSYRDDCDDMDRMIKPGVKETCNYKDDNCNGRSDEGVRPSCGVGWCRREAASCEPNAACVPNAPRAELCNGFDDDCDDVIDNVASGASLCAEGKACYKGSCIAKDAAEMMAAAEPPPPPKDAGSSGGVDAGAGGGSSAGSGGATGSGSGGGQTPGGSSPSDGDEVEPQKVGCQYGAAAAPIGPGLGLGLFALWLWRARRRSR